MPEDRLERLEKELSIVQVTLANMLANCATKADLAALRGEMLAAMAELRGQVRADMQTMRGEMGAAMETMRGDMNATMSTAGTSIPSVKQRALESNPVSACLNSSMTFSRYAVLIEPFT